MRAAGHPLPVLSQAEEDTIHRNALRICAEVGLQVEHEGLLERLAAAGGRIDRTTQRVAFAPETVEAFLAATTPAGQWRDPPRLGCSVWLYHGYYLDPLSDEYLPLTVERAWDYVRLARSLPEADDIGILGCPLAGVPAEAEPLYERLYAWRFGIHPGGAIHRTELCQPILDMCQIHAGFTGQALDRVFTGSVYLQPPLKLGHHEAAQVAWFLERGLRVAIGGSMATGGATAPISLAGMATLTIAEHLLLGLLNRALYGDQTWGIWMAATALDMRTMFRPYGRPDMALANLVGAQMARRYGAEFSGHSGLTDAMKPSPQAAAQKTISALATLLAAGRATVHAGLLGVDEVFSPLQMALDAELVRALRCFTHEYIFSDEAIGGETIAAAGPGGNFTAEPHTVAWLRRELWEPRLWERRPFSAWQTGDGKTDVERAQEQVRSILAVADRLPGLDEVEERELARVISAARQSLA